MKKNTPLHFKNEETKLIERTLQLPYTPRLPSHRPQIFISKACYS